MLVSTRFLTLAKGQDSLLKMKFSGLFVERVVGVKKRRKRVARAAVVRPSRKEGGHQRGTFVH